MRKVLLILIFMIAPNLFSQNRDGQEVRIVNHSVMMGETVRMLSKKYLVPPSEIYKLNKFAIDGISQGMVLRIPVPVKDEPIAETAAEPDAGSSREISSDSAYVEPSAKVSADGQQLQHKVAAGETLSGLAQQYGVSVQDIKDANPKVAKRGLYSDETIVIPAAGGIVPSNEGISRTTTENNGSAADGGSGGETIRHKVQPGETLIGLAQKYNVPVDVIKSQNARILARGLQAGQVIKITP